MNTITYYKDEPILDSKLGIKTNRLVRISDFLDEKELDILMDILKNDELPWSETSFNKSYGISLVDMESNLESRGLSKDYFLNLSKKFKSTVESIFEHPVLDTYVQAQRWSKGGQADPHSDNSDYKGNVSEFSKLKYVSILYANSDYSGGEIYFPDHGLEIKPEKNDLLVFPGGFENIHGVKEVTSGFRYTIMAFWDF